MRPRTPYGVDHSPHWWCRWQERRCQCGNRDFRVYSDDRPRDLSAAWAAVTGALGEAHTKLVDDPALALGLDDVYLPRLMVDIEFYFEALGEGPQLRRHLDRIRAELKA